MKDPKLAAIRAENKRALGLGGPLDTVLGSTGAIQSVTLATSFPSASYTWEPGATAPSEGGQGSFYADWLLSHVVRPSVVIQTPFGPVTMAPYQAAPDYSSAVAAGAVLAGGLGLLGVVYVLARAFARRRRAA